MTKKYFTGQAIINTASFVCFTHVFVTIVKYLYYNKYIFELLESFAIDLLAILVIGFLSEKGREKGDFGRCFLSYLKMYFSKGQVALTIVFGTLLSSVILQRLVFAPNMFLLNKEYIKDLAICVFILFPMGKVYARKGVGKALGLGMEIGLLGLSGYMLWIIWIVYTNRVIYNYSGGGIGMLECNGTLQLKINCHPNTVGAYSGLLFLLCVWLSVKKRGLKKALYIFESVIHFAILSLSNSRGSFFAMLCTFMIITVLISYYGFRKQTNVKRWCISILIGGISIVILYFARNLFFSAYEAVRIAKPIEGKEVEEVIRDINVTSFSGRELIWSNSLKIITRSAGNFLLGVTPARIPGLLQDLLHWEIGVYTHNQILEVAADIGVPAAIVFLVFLVKLGISCLRQGLEAEEKRDWRDKILILLLFFLMVSNIMEATLLFYDYLSGCAFVLLGGWIFGRENDDGKVESGIS